MTTWMPSEQPPAGRLATWVRLADESIIFAEYRPVNRVWLARGGRVVWPVEWQSYTPDPEPEEAGGGRAEKENDDWLICSADRFIDHWLAGWEAGTIARPASCTR